MKKNLLFILCSLLVGVAYAQPTFTSSFSPVAGTTGSIQPANSSGVTFGSTGANQIWDYSSVLTDSSSANAYSYVAASSTPYQSTFPSANLASGGTSSDYIYYISNSSVFEIDGIVIPSAYTFYYTEPEVLFQYPFSNDTTYITTFSGNYTYQGETDDRTGTDTFEADGYGTLKLPNGHTFTNVLRTVLIQNYNDYFTPDDYTVYERTYTVDYFTPSVLATPLLSIETLVEDYPGVYDYSYNFVNYYTNAPSGINNINPLVENLNVFPNPSYLQSTVSLSLKDGANINVYVTNIIGQRVKTIVTEQADAGNHIYTIETGDMAKGMYLVTVEVNGAIAGIRKLEIE